MLLICEKCRQTYAALDDARCCEVCGFQHDAAVFWLLGDRCRCGGVLLEAVVMSRAEARKLAGVVDETPAQGSQP